MEDEYLKLLKLSCKFLKFGGMDIEGNIIVLHIYALFVSVLTIFLLILAVIEVILNYKGLDTFANALETICLNWAFFFRIAVYIFNFRKIQALIANVNNNLWPIDKFGDVIRDKIQGIIDIEVKCIKIIVSFLFISLIVTYGKPLLVHPRALPLACYLIIDISDTKSYCLMYLLQICLMCIQILLLLGWNAMFLSFTTYLVTQFSMLKHAFRSLSSESTSSVEDEAKCYENLKEYVDYHNKLLQFAKEMKNVYYVELFLQVVTMTVSICIQLYFVNAAGFSDLPTITKAIGFTADYLIEFFLFCFAGNEFTKACEIADATYNNGWEKKSKRFKIATRMIILQSQVPQALTGGGIFEINLNGYTNVVRMAFSVYTLLKSFREEYY